MKRIQISSFIFLLLLLFNRSSAFAENIAFANFAGFPEGEIETNGYNAKGLGWDKNPYYKQSLRLLGQGSFFYFSLMSVLYLKTLFYLLSIFHQLRQIATMEGILRFQ